MLRVWMRRRSMPASIQLRLHPVFDARLGHIAFDYASSFGPIHSDWTIAGKTAQWHIQHSCQYDRLARARMGRGR
jgi:hypothetical protein